MSVWYCSRGTRKVLLTSETDTAVTAARRACSSCPWTESLTITLTDPDGISDISRPDRHVSRTIRSIRCPKPLRADALPINRSRELIRDAIGAPSDLALVVAARDVADELSASGARALLAGTPYRELTLDQLYETRGHTALLLGRGFSRQDHDVMPRALAVAELRFHRVIVLPCALDPTDDVVQRALSRSRATVFASDPESYRQIEPLCEAQLAHDCAFFLELSGEQTGGSGELAALGEDLGAIDAPALLRAIAESHEVRTDRARVMIAAALMGKPVRYLRGPDHELEALAHHFLDGYAVTEIPPDAPGPVGPAPLDEAAQRTLELLQMAAPAAPSPVRAASEATGDGSPAPRISMVILTRGRAALLHRALDSVARSQVPTRTIVIDNNSPPAEAEAVCAVCGAHANVELRRSERGLGSSGGRNLGVTLAGDTEFVCFLDDDAEFVPGALEHLLTELDGHPDAGAVTATVVRPDGTLTYAGGRMDVTDELATFHSTGDEAPFATTERAAERTDGVGPVHRAAGPTRSARTIPLGRGHRAIFRRQRMVLSRLASSGQRVPILARCAGSAPCEAGAPARAGLDFSFEAGRAAERLRPFLPTHWPAPRTVAV